MWLRWATCVAMAIAPCVYAQDDRSRLDVLTLDAALERVGRVHPDLRLSDARRPLLEAGIDAASQRPPLTAGATLENFAGNGPYAGAGRAELTVTLAGVLERGGKLEARRAVAMAQLDALAPQREVLRLDLLAETARRYLDVTAAQRQRDIALEDIAQRKRAVDAAQRRLSAGASPESALMTAQAALAQAQLDRDRAYQAEEVARLRLAALWNGREGQFRTAAGDPLALPALEDFRQLAEWLERTPELAALAGQARVREAELRLAQSARQPDLQWQAGLRGLNGDDALALTGGFSLPLGSASRAAPGIRAAEAGLRLGDAERDAMRSRLYVLLASAHGQYTTARLEAARLGTDVLPRLARAELAADRAWRAGAISYLEWSQLQAMRVEARKRQLDVAVQAQQALIEIQRLTGQPLVAPGLASLPETAP
ncbi:TolC family protein [Stenotrophomonas sp. HITSZ_GD]|uniref:TolC family protein n=1 Tax=Stenotrophomonas sp. HITSZ_GD TaxID=3037248 RepID=UPI00240D65F2|nr:TolC family protein [Stenotrophomonas sp. HITSZ_GD]MDG2524127.1 TolC family protein [Stenotrophomonas sp. HITSZ_GD]